MPIIKCKMCGGDIQLAEDKTFGTCEYCGSVMTLPRVSDEQRAAAFNRGNHFRRAGEFDKALGVYEHIVADDDTDAEAHWCCALCRFGIEYVEDPATYEWLPTCHRASFDSFLEDVDYLAALEHSDGITRRQYQKDAARIAEVQRGILAASQNTEPYDVFISYKELDENGERTRDSILAQEIYYRLTEKGWRVFFSRISLEDVPGTQYEPYIFAALNSAKVMVVVGTSGENLNAVWVKNEWSRFLAMMRKDRSKLLIPCYRDMDPYDLPEQLSVLMSYDMGKIGFIQDLIRGVDKVLSAEKKEEVVKETVVVQQSGGPNIAALLKRGQQALEDGEWDKAKDFFDQVLNMDAENAEAFLGIFLAETEFPDEDTYIKHACSLHAEPETLYIPIAKDRIEAVIKRYAIRNYLDESEIRELFKYDLRYSSAYKGQKQIADREKERFNADRNLVRAYRYAKGESSVRLRNFRTMLFAGLEANVTKAHEKENATRKNSQDTYTSFLFEAESIAAERHNKAEAKREADYQSALHSFELANSSDTYQKTKSLFLVLTLYKDSAEMARLCDEEMARIEREESAEAERKRKTAAEEARRHWLERERIEKARALRRTRTILVIIVLAVGSLLVYIRVIIPSNGYKTAEALFTVGQYEDALTTFKALGGYKDSPAKVEKIKEAILLRNYATADTLVELGSLAQAAISYGKLGDYKDARERSFALWDQIAQRDAVVAGAVHTVGLRTDGSVIAVGSNSNGQCEASGWTDIVAVAAGGAHTVGLRSDGSVVAVGLNNDSQCFVSGWTDIVAVAADYNHTVGLRSDGSVVAVGLNTDGQCGVSGWTDIVAVTMGGRHTVGLRSDGSVVAVGLNTDGQCGVSNWTDIVAVAAGGWHTVGLKADGSVVAVGNNSYGRCYVSNWTDIMAVAAGAYHTVGLRADGSVVAVGRNDEGQCDVSDWTDIVAIAAGWNHTVGLKADGTVVAVGSNDDGQCNVSGWTDIKLPNT